jgi:hypothetical protein
MTDKTLVCKDCGKDFIFTEGEQQFYVEKGFTNEPTRCKECRTAKKERFNSNGGNSGGNSNGGNRPQKRDSFNSPRISKY